MFFNQPYTSFSPYQSASALLPIKGKINWGTLLTNTQKTLGVINQAIPIFYQFGPIVRNAKTMFKVMGEFNKINSDETTKNSSTNKDNSNKSSATTNTNSPNFFV